MDIKSTRRCAFTLSDQVCHMLSSTCMLQDFLPDVIPNLSKTSRQLMVLNKIMKTTKRCLLNEVPYHLFPLQLFICFLSGNVFITLQIGLV